MLPLIGNLDTDRAQLLLKQTLKQAERLKMQSLIMDLSGVQIVDTIVVHQIFQVIEALKLIGVNTLLTGIRPEIAQNMITIGMEIKGLKTKSTLEQALTYIKLSHH
ncbi:STAS domain-containing protein [Peribacillus deserti]|uniref:STAS domain-containing protein n=1 Tax=Peribacillus deserti TaxID=673318 RepID=UPI0015E135BE|nr:STAS domain-containing protein [Peribacillus deserti]